MFNICNENGYVCFSSHNIWFKNSNENYKVFEDHVVSLKMEQVYINPIYIHKFLEQCSNEIIIIDRSGNIVDIFENKTKSC